MDEGICYIIGAGDFTARDLAPRPEDFVIAADAGLENLEQVGIVPHLIVGDFDSLGYTPQGENVQVYQAEKDDTDMGLAVHLGWEQGFRRFRLYGGSGSRPDHFLANLQTLSAISRQGGEGRLVCPGFTVAAVTDGTLLFDAQCRGYVSVFCQGDEARGVTLEGLKYPLTEAVLTCSFPLGCSNEFLGVPARISVKSGTLLVLWYE